MIDDAIVWHVRRIALVVVANKLHRTAQQSTWPLTSSRQISSAAKNCLPLTAIAPVRAVLRPTLIGRGPPSTSACAEQPCHNRRP